jgi:hypothetical protein
MHSAPTVAVILLFSPHSPLTKNGPDDADHPATLANVAHHADDDDAGTKAAVAKALVAVVAASRCRCGGRIRRIDHPHLYPHRDPEETTSRGSLYTQEQQVKTVNTIKSPFHRGGKRWSGLSRCRLPSSLFVPRQEITVHDLTKAVQDLFQRQSRG